MVLLAVPLAIWSASCSCVVFISCCIKIDDWGHFRVGEVDFMTFILQCSGSMNLTTFKIFSVLCIIPDVHHPRAGRKSQVC